MVISDKGGGMKKIRLLSWNVNGLRAVYKKGFTEWFARESPDMLCLQETKASEDQLPVDLRTPGGYSAYFSSAEKKGYSGVALYTRQQPQSIAHGLGDNECDREGRVIIAYYDGFALCNIYFPNGKQSEDRLRYKLAFYDSFLDYLMRIKKKVKTVVICGDVNTAHREIDLARPKANEKVSGFLPVERQWIDKLLTSGFVDTFRLFESGPGHYTWWDLQSRARERNVGWRIDYFFVNKEAVPRVHNAGILADVTGSDHCPVGLEISV